jgi:hypothetical protein
MGYFFLLSNYAARAVPMTVLLSASVLAGIIAQNQPQVQPLAEQTECGSAYQYVRHSPSSRVLSENLGPLLVAGKPISVSDPFVYSQFVEHDRQVADLVNKGYFGLIVMSYDPFQIKVRGSDVWLGSLATDIELNYRVVGRFNCRDARVMLEPLSFANTAH